MILRSFSPFRSWLGSLVLAAAACSGGGMEDPDAAPVFVSGPTIIANPNVKVPLVAIVELSTDVATSVQLTVAGGGEERTIPFDEVDTEHALPVLGMGPDTEYTIEVTAIDAEGRESSAPEPLFFSTDPLPEDFPPIDVTESNPMIGEPGVILFDVFRWTDSGPDGTYGLLVGVDLSGKVVWYYRTSDHRVGDVRRLKNGNLLYLHGHEGAVEIDMLGNTVRRWHASGLGQEAPSQSTAVPVDSFHHEIFEMPSGNFLFLSSELRNFVDYPSSEEDPDAPTEEADVIADVIVEMAPDGTVVDEWSLFDILDPYRIGYGSLGGFWNRDYAGVAPDGTRDWSHANAVIYDPGDDGIIVSVRHQDAVIEFARETGELRWILGTHDNWDTDWASYLLTPTDTTEWQFHQHAPQITSDGTLLLYDNGNFRATPFDTKLAASENYSRAVEYSIDEDLMTVDQLWDYGGIGENEETFYSPFICDADELPVTGNILVTDGGRVVDEEGVPIDDVRGGKQWARIAEVTATEPPVKALELILEDPSDVDPIGWSVYRSEKLPDIYP